MLNTLLNWLILILWCYKKLCATAIPQNTQSAALSLLALSLSKWEMQILLECASFKTCQL